MRIQKIFPFIGWFPYSGNKLLHDLAAGASVALLLIPQAMAYADLAGMPAHYGLYAAFVPVLLGALFGSLSQLNTGPSAMSAILTASALTSLAASGSEQYIQYALVLALMVGILRLVFGLLRMAFLVNFVSYPVVLGFTNAAAIIIAFSQLNKLFGISIDKTQGFLGTLQDIFQLFLKVPQTHAATLIMGAAALVLIYVLKKLLPKLPSVLFVLILSTLVSALIGFEGNFGGKVIGQVPAGLPALSNPFAVIAGNEDPLQLIIKLFPGALMVTIIGFMEVLSISKSISARTKQELNLNQELIGQGMAALGASFSSAYPVSGSFSRSAMNLMSGAKTGFSNVISALLVMLSLLFLTPYLYHLPMSALGAAIIVSVVKLFDFKSFRSILKLSLSEGIISLLTFSATLIFAPSISSGIIIGMLLAIASYLWGTMRPKMAELGLCNDGRYRDIKNNQIKANENFPIIRMDGSLYFASSTPFEEFVLNIISKYKETRFILLNAEGINRIDVSGEWGLSKVLDDLETNNISLVISGLKNEPLQVLVRSGLHERIGKIHFFHTMKEAVTYIENELKEEISEEGSTEKEAPN